MEVSADTALAGLHGQWDDDQCDEGGSDISKMQIDVAESASSVEDGAGMLPVLKVTVRKLPGPRWQGFIQSIGEDSILQ